MYNAEGGWRSAYRRRDADYVMRKIRPSLKTYLVAVAVVLVSNYIGILDHILATPFRRFRWPPYVDVQEQVQLRMSGDPATILYENNWDCVYNQRLRPRSHFCAEGNQPLVLIAVKSAIAHFDRRAMIRQLWGKERRNNTTLLIATVFVLGYSNDASINLRAKEENEQYGDLLMGDFLDAYKNNTLKFISALQFLVERCGSGVNYALLVDDDYHVSVRNLVFMLLGASANANEDLYAGWRFDTSPFRARWHKHFVSVTEYPFNAYPPYISAGAVVISRITARKMFYASHFVRYYPYDDIYAGIIAFLLGIEPTHDDHFCFWTPWTYRPGDYLDVVAAHGFSDLQLMRQAFLDSEAVVAEISFRASIQEMISRHFLFK